MATSPPAAGIAETSSAMLIERRAREIESVAQLQPEVYQNHAELSNLQQVLNDAIVQKVPNAVILLLTVLDMV